MDNFEKDINEEIKEEAVLETIETDENEEYVKIEVDSVTEENEDGEIIELLDLEEKPKKSILKEILDWVYSIAMALAVVLVLHIFVFVMVNVSGSSMYPTLVDGDRLVASRLYFEPENEDIVVVEPYLSEGTVKGKMMFGRTLYEMVNDGMNAKLTHMPDESREKMCRTIEKIINEGASGLICILL